MKLLSASALVAIALLSAGCSGCAAVDKVTAITSAPSRTTIDEKTVLAAEVAYGAALDTVIQGAKDGRIKGDDAKAVKVIIEKAIPARQALETALHAANSNDLMARFNDFRQLTAELSAIGAH